MNWKPISQYDPQIGRVLIWLEWATHFRGQPNMKGGEAQFAYIIETRTGPVWVESKDCIPIETTGREVTHFMQLTPPEPEGKES